MAVSVDTLSGSGTIALKMVQVNHLLLLLCSLLFAGSTIEALPYDYSASIECLKEPLKPQYGGGIIVNPEFDHGFKGWSVFGRGKIEIKAPNSRGNNFIAAHSRRKPYDSFSQKLHMEKDKLYTFSSWIQVSEGRETVAAVFKTNSGFKHAGVVVAKSGCWSMLKGGLTVDKTGIAELYFESNNTSVEIWVDSVSLQPFTQEEWSSHQAESIEKVRKRTVKIRATDANGKTIEGATVSLRHRNSGIGFPFGTAITKEILTNTAYQNWFTSRFTVTVFENEMKWYSTENTPGKEDYSIPDAMVKFAQQHGIAVRGHNILWDDPKYQPWWVNSLSSDQLKEAADRRLNSVVSRYCGQVIAWDVINENMHWHFFEDKVGPNASEYYFQRAQQLDSKAVMFLNEYNTIERSGESTAGPAKYIEKMNEIWNSGFKGQIGIGLEGHFDTVNIPYMRATLDTLAATKQPIWLTEVDVGKSENQATYLDQVLREAHSHPAIQGIMLWASWSPSGCWRMCLTDNNFKNLPTGDVVDKLIDEWRHGHTKGTTDSNGYFETSLFHGDYDVVITHPSVNSSVTNSFNVIAAEASEPTEIHVHVVAQ